MCGVAEYDELPVRHNEDKINTALSGEVRWPTESRLADDPHTKANLLLQVQLKATYVCATCPIGRPLALHSRAHLLRYMRPDMLL